MSIALSKELQKKWKVRSIPVRKNDEVMIVRGQFKNRDGKVNSVYRKKFVIHVERIQREKNNGANVYLGVAPSNCVITKLDMTNDRQKRLENRKADKEGAKDKGKYNADDVSMATLD